MRKDHQEEKKQKSDWIKLKKTDKIKQILKKERNYKEIKSWITKKQKPTI